ncbi:MAG: DNA/RNA nuclease SfsA [Proteobacteria bacterium]|nr:DNA/RNA nuclease SfsA [Pseudomonadota bacterium]
MKFKSPLTQGTLIKRYKRFLADIELDDHTLVTAHVPNTGSMKSTSDPGSRVALSYHPSPKRKLKWTLELIQGERGAWVGVNTALTNHIVEEAIKKREIASLLGYDEILREVNYGNRSRIDLLLRKERSLCYVEVKNVTYKQGNRALFPDAVTTRGQKHLVELRNVVRQGHRGVTFYLVNRGDCKSMAPAREIDPMYAKLLKQVAGEGVEILAYQTNPDPSGIETGRRLRIYL